MYITGKAIQKLVHLKSRNFKDEEDKPEGGVLATATLERRDGGT